MLGGGDTSASVLGSRTGGDASAAGDRNGAAACAGNMFGSNGNTSNNSGEDDRGERSFGGNRWPRQETLALLKIRSDMDVTFREGSVKGPLWEEVSRKLAELGYHRNAKKCREKFENVYKYHKRTKDGRGGKAHGGGNTYRFFDQLQAFHNHPSIQLPQPQSKPATAAAATNPPSLQQNIQLPSFPSTNPNPTSQIISPPPPTSPTLPSFPNISPADLMSNSTSSSSSSALGLEGHRKRKRKWKALFERLMKEVVEKQEEMHNNFLEAIEKRERERMAREEAWRMQEMSRLNREREMLAHQRSIAAAQDAAVMAFLQNLSEQRHRNQETNPLPPQQQQAPSKPASAPPPPDNGNQSYRPSSSRWPKVEIEALIKIRSNLEAKYEDSGPKGPLWEDISAAMKRLGYNRNAKRCKEKWENINKYFKKVKESNKKRPEDSKTCPYFQQLDALYREKNKHESKPQSSAPLLVRPEQQWPPPRHGMEDMESDQNQEEDDKDCDDEEEDDKDCDDEEEDEGGSFEIVASKPASMGTDE
ncbi:hypothetical protein HRI_000150600 [Hibiscus trionum]|uniref:Myb-like domain-containing protein n=1 Tax=Hibiscus trionum TaxID=183268 RepID=A0A9W7GT46_HIBTR|nr:hypothetical protein HRI_000150600 [Hibiscus trionum]